VWSTTFGRADAQPLWILIIHVDFASPKGAGSISASAAAVAHEIPTRPLKELPGSAMFRSQHHRRNWYPTRKLTRAETQRRGEERFNNNSAPARGLFARKISV
jgi:hypothetical protein